MTSPCAACSLEFDPQALKGKSFWEGITTGANYGAKVLEAHHALLAEKDRTIAELREVVNGMLPYFRMFVWADPTAQGGIVEQAESVLARKKEP